MSKNPGDDGDSPVLLLLSLMDCPAYLSNVISQRSVFGLTDNDECS